VRAARPLDLVHGIKQAVWTIDPAQPVGEPMLVEHLLANSLTQERFAAVLMGTFAALALVLAAAGVYAVLAQLVAQRRQEIGIRIALGAAAADVARLIVTRGLILTAIGVAIGMAAAWAAARVLSTQLYEITPHDPWSFTAVPVTLLAIALLASWLPARRALSVDPASALRTE
jgi:putative ABC transport system permease protein